MPEFKEIEGKLDAGTIGKLEKFYASIFGNEKLDKFGARLAAAFNPLTVLALEEEKIVGFKIGYELDPKVFYSWVGGVDQRLRQQGIAAELMRRQHAWCARKGYEKIRTKTMNRFKSMLILDLKSGFEIVEVYRDAADQIKIVLEKKLPA